MTKFISFHPVSEFIYFTSLLIIIMFNNNPVFSFVSLLSGIMFYLKIKQDIKSFKEILRLLILFAAVALTNPFFSHRGVTVLFFVNNNPITLEAFLYGVNLGCMIISVLVWFKILNTVFTDDKWLYLTGKFSPKLSLLISSAFYFVGRLKIKGKQVSDAQKALGLFSTDTFYLRLKSYLSVYSALITWGLENAVDKGNSMKSRGYGEAKRSHYSFYTFKKRDLFFTGLIAALDITAVLLILKTRMEFNFYPTLSVPRFNFHIGIIYSVFTLLCFLPLIISIKGDMKWHYLKSGI